MNYFLYADVGTGPDGMSVTVLSALARLGMDPWQEAERLATLSRAAAVDGLARLIATMPASHWPPAEAADIAARLVLLLPRPGAGPATRPAAASPRLKALPPLRTLITPAPATQWAILAVVLFCAAVAVVMTLPGHVAPISTNANIVQGASSAGRFEFPFNRPGDRHARTRADHTPLPHVG